MFTAISFQKSSINLKYSEKLCKQSRLCKTILPSYSHSHSHYSYPFLQKRETIDLDFSCLKLHDSQEEMKENVTHVSHVSHVTHEVDINMKQRRRSKNRRRDELNEDNGYNENISHNVEGRLTRKRKKEMDQLKNEPTTDITDNNVTDNLRTINEQKTISKRRKVHCTSMDIDKKEYTLFDRIARNMYCSVTLKQEDYKALQNEILTYMKEDEQQFKNFLFCLGKLQFSHFSRIIQALDPVLFQAGTNDNVDDNVDDNDDNKMMESSSSSSPSLILHNIINGAIEYNNGKVYRYAIMKAMQYDIFNEISSCEIMFDVSNEESIFQRFRFVRRYIHLPKLTYENALEISKERDFKEAATFFEKMLNTTNWN